MKKSLIILLILLCAFAVFAEESATLDVTLEVTSKGPYFAFSTKQVNSFSEVPESISESKALDPSDLTGLVGDETLYAIVRTNSPSAVSAELSWSDFSASGVETSIPLTISSAKCYIKGSEFDLDDLTSASDTSNGKKDGADTASITLKEPKNTTDASNEARAVNFLLELEANKSAFNNATYVETGYSTTLTLTVAGA